MPGVPVKIVDWFRRRGRVSLLLWLGSWLTVGFVSSKLFGRPTLGVLLPAFACGIGGWVYQFFIDTEREDQVVAFRQWFSLLPMYAGLASAVLWLPASLIYFHEIETGFYEVAAQIFPVLLLALILDVRQSHNLQSSDLVPTIATLVCGEIVALFFAAGAKGVLGYTIVCAALTSGFIALIMAAIADYEATPSEEEPADPSRQVPPESNTVATMRHGGDRAQTPQTLKPEQGKIPVARFVLKRSSNGKYYFNLTATNGEVISTSEAYESKASAMNGIESVTRNAPTAEIDDQTDK